MRCLNFACEYNCTNENNHCELLVALMACPEAIIEHEGSKEAYEVNLDLLKEPE